MQYNSPTRSSTFQKYKAIKARYDHLYNGKRIRHDDVVKQLGEEFFCTEQTILRALRADLPDYITADGVRSKQANLFEPNQG